MDLHRLIDYRQYAAGKKLTDRTIPEFINAKLLPVR